MARIFTGEGVDLTPLQGRVIAVIGYGNQGRAQGLNLRDSGLRVLVGNIRDASWEQAEADGMKVLPIPEAAREGDVILFLVPDEVAPRVYEESVAPVLGKGKVLDVASGYNLAYGFIRPAPEVDVIMVAPRMIGRGVRERFLRGEGFPVLVGVEQDASGKAWEVALALSKGIGAFLPGGCAVESSCMEETVVDLFSEHTWAGAFLFLLRACYEVLTSAGVSPEVALLELYASGELEEVGRAMAEIGLMRQLRVHSRTSQYGQLTRGPRFVTPELQRMLREALEGIRSGEFAREWALEQMVGMPVYRRRWEEVLEHPMQDAEDRLYRLLRRIPVGVGGKGEDGRGANRSRKEGCPAFCLVLPPT